MYPSTVGFLDATNDQQKPHNQREPGYHFSSSHSLSNCCLNSLDPVEIAHHKKDTSRPPLTWSNVGCEFEKAKFLLDTEREQECLDFLSQPWVLANLGPHRVTRIAKRFNIEFLQERVALHKLIRRLAKSKLNGSSICQFAARRVNFVVDLDWLTGAPPSYFNTNAVENSSLLRILKWAHAKDEILTLSLMEQFLLADEEEKYFNHYMHLHLANRFNFPTLRMRCLSSLRTVECIDDFKNSRNYMKHLSPIDRELIEKRLEILREYRDADEAVPDEVFHFDLHSDCYFDESIQARYIRDLDPNSELLSNSDLNLNTESDSSMELISGGFGGEEGEITGLDFIY